MTIDQLELKAKSLRALADRIDSMVERMRPLAADLDQLISDLPSDVSEAPTTQMDWVLYILKHDGPTSTLEIQNRINKALSRQIPYNDVCVLLSRLKGNHKITRDSKKLWRIATP